MPHPSSDPSPGGTIPGPSGTTPSRHVLLTACATMALLMALFLATPPAAVADPQLSEEELQAKIERLNTKVEKLTEKYNKQRIELKEARKAARQAKRRSRKLDKRLQKAREAVGELAAVAYKGGGLQPPLALITAESPRSLLERADMLAHMSHQRMATLNRLQKAAKRAEQAEKEAERKAKRVQRLTTRIADKKKRISNLVEKAEEKLNELQAMNAGTVGGTNEGPGSEPVADNGGTSASLSDDEQSSNTDVAGSSVAARATQIALNQVGDPYVWGAAGPDAFDCSGLIVYAYGKVGIDLPHYTGYLWDSGTHVSRSELQVGDLVFTSAHHVGIYVGDGKFVNAPNSTTVVQVEPIESFYGAVRIVD